MGGQLVNELVASGFLDGSDRHDGVSPSEDLCGLRKRVVVVAGDHEKAGQLLDLLREGAFGDHRVRLRSPFDRPCPTAVGEPGAAGNGAATRLEQLDELEVGVEGGLMIALGAAALDNDGPQSQ